MEIFSVIPVLLWSSASLSCTLGQGRQVNSRPAPSSKDEGDFRWQRSPFHGYQYPRTKRHCQQEAFHFQAYLDIRFTEEDDHVYNLPFQHFILTIAATATASASTNQHQRTHSAGASCVELPVALPSNTPFANQVAVALTFVLLLRLSVQCMFYIVQADRLLVDDLFVRRVCVSTTGSPSR